MCTAQDMVQVRCTAAVSCHVFFLNGALRDVTFGGSQLPPSPKGVTPAVAHTTLLLVLPVCSCREGPEHFGPTPPRILWARVVQAPIRLLSNRLSGKTQAKTSLKALTFMPFSCEKLSRGINLCLEGINPPAL